MRKNPHTKILYITCERFTNDFIGALCSNRMNEFKNRYRTVDILLVDDIQFLGGKVETQEEFFHTFNQLYQNNKQIVISCDRPPKAIPSLEDRLTSRFESGMLADVGSPDFETRCAILDTKCQESSTPWIVRSSITWRRSYRPTSESLRALNKIIAFHQFKKHSTNHRDGQTHPLEFPARDQPQERDTKNSSSSRSPTTSMFTWMTCLGKADRSVSRSRAKS